MSMRAFDFTPVLFAILALFVVAGTFQFLGSWPAAQRGLLSFERACPIYERHPDYHSLKAGYDKPAETFRAPSGLSG
jgi:hypothetical protein